MLTLSRTMNPVEIADEMGRSTARVRVKLKEMGVPILKWCNGCEKNLPQSAFKHNGMKLCKMHTPKKTVAPYEQDVQEVAARKFLQEVAPLQTLWMATPGDFRNPWAESYRGQ